MPGSAAAACAPTVFCEASSRCSRGNRTRRSRRRGGVGGVRRCRRTMTKVGEVYTRHSRLKYASQSVPAKCAQYRGVHCVLLSPGQFLELRIYSPTVEPTVALPVNTLIRVLSFCRSGKRRPPYAMNLVESTWTLGLGPTPHDLHTNTAIVLLLYTQTLRYIRALTF